MRPHSSCVAARAGEERAVRHEEGEEGAARGERRERRGLGEERGRREAARGGGRVRKRGGREGASLGEEREEGGGAGRREGEGERKLMTSMGDPEEAREFLDTEDDVNLVLIDYHMTQMTGYDLLKKVKESPRLRHIPVVIVFTHYTPEELKRCFDAGAEDYIVKPITVADVPRILNHI
ncbi:hypothetical protein QOZ80_4AG0322740 [Eleusine coracana subsp. coracana]|nr:hypothetical protein QOZ80_4AG0322740 [Eleusine coracana subsp. coracana]